MKNWMTNYLTAAPLPGTQTTGNEAWRFKRVRCKATTYRGECESIHSSYTSSTQLKPDCCRSIPHPGHHHLTTLRQSPYHLLLLLLPLELLHAQDLLPAGDGRRYLTHGLLEKVWTEPLSQVIDRGAPVFNAPTHLGERRVVVVVAHQRMLKGSATWLLRLLLLLLGLLGWWGMRGLAVLMLLVMLGGVGCLVTLLLLEQLCQFKQRNSFMLIFPLCIACHPQTVITVLKTLSS